MPERVRVILPGNQQVSVASKKDAERLYPTKTTGATYEDGKPIVAAKEAPKSETKDGEKS